VKRPLPIIFALLTALALPLAMATSLALAPQPAPAQQELFGNPYAEAIIDLKTGKERPRSIENPQYISSADASLTLDKRDVVFLVEPENAGGRALILPQRIMVHHEIANLEFDGNKAAVVYSPLTGVVRGFKGSVDGRRTGFGTTGKFLNSFRLIYDRATNSLWLPLTGRAIDGSMIGQALEAFPVLWTTWQQANAAYPDARVLAGGALVDADYKRDPYGSYQRSDTYYHKGGSYFPLMHTDLRQKPKDVVVVPATTTPKVALIKDAVARERVVNVEKGITRVVAFYDEPLGVVRLFEPEVGGRELTFGFANGTIFDHQTRSKWTPNGQAFEGRLRGRSLAPVKSLHMFWFAWAAFFPETMIAPN
jgi:hypothetical protein